MRVSRSSITAVTLAVLVTTLAVGSRAALQGQTGTYTLVMRDGRRPLPYRSAGNSDLIALDDLASLFNLTVTEDTVAGGLMIVGRGQRIVLTPGQSLASVNGRIVSIGAPAVRDARGWAVPVDFLSRALGPALNTRIEVRRASHLILVGDLRMPQVTGRFERLGADGRLSLDLQPPAPHKTSLENGRLIVRIEADAIDLGPVSGLSPEYVTGVRVDGSTVVIDVTPGVTGFRSDDSDPSRSTIDLLTPASTTVPRPAPPTPPQVPRPVEIAPPGLVRTVVIDPGHGGDDEGAHGPGGSKEKDLTLQIARRLKSVIESRVGLRVQLTRDADENIPPDRRAAFANNNKADMFVSLHANASVRPEVRGAQVLSLSLEDYGGRATGAGPAVSVPVIGGGTRVIEAVPWELAQLPFASHSAALAGIVMQHLIDEHVPLYGRAIDQAPLRVLVGANMPAVLVELGFLSNKDDEKALTTGELPTSIINALVSTIVQVRNGIPAKPPGNTGTR